MNSATASAIHSGSRHLVACSVSTGMRTVLTRPSAALKEAREARAAIWASSSAAGRVPPAEGEELLAPATARVMTREPLIYASRLTQGGQHLIQDGFELYHHTFIFFVPGCARGRWCSRLNAGRKHRARYHWNSMRLRASSPSPMPRSPAIVASTSSTSWRVKARSIARPSPPDA